MTASVPLADLADIQIGYQHRDRARPLGSDPAGSHRIVQIKDLDLRGEYKGTVLDGGGAAPYVWPGDLDRVTPAGGPTRYVVSRGDVLFLSRGKRPLAVPMRDSPRDTIASYYFYILRPDPDRVRFEYLAWYINQPAAQTFLESHQRGSHIQMIPRNAFEKLEVPLPPLRIQDRITELERLRQREQFAMERLIDARRRLVTGLALKAVTQPSRTPRTH